MTRDRIGGYPYDVSRDGAETVLRFFPKKTGAKEPGTLIMKLTLNNDDRKKLVQVLVDQF